ncbi:Serine/Threonine protein kinase [Cedratvirus Zaza IHUMI]|uniref:Serine/Threonine protein kinase n=1 Tax=Cedratvirus Zaza IHUMI TaxID=2126979 RepID=A0A2R8FF22_9VIRU|nr:Serine/Threonine protein kinase [Cedratvirus Zaza IHUMI]
MGQYLERLGQGSYGTVYKFKREEQAKALCSEQLFAIKVFDGSDQSQGVPSASEMALAMMLDHPHIIKHHEIMYNPDKGTFKLLMDLADSDLDHVIEKEKPSRELCYNYFLQLCSAVKYLHDANIAHFDIKPANCLFKQGVLKLCDFGISRFAFVEETNVRPTFAAPETYYLMGSSYRNVHAIYNRTRHCPKAADMWSLGETLFFMLTGKVMFDEDRKGMLQKVEFSKDRQGFLREYGLLPEEIDLLLSLLELGINVRAKIDQVIQHKLFANLSFPSYEPLSLPVLSGSEPKDNSTAKSLIKTTTNWELSSSLIKATNIMYHHLYRKYWRRESLLWSCCLYLCSKMYNGRDILMGDILFLVGERYSEMEVLGMEKTIFLELKERCLFSLVN